MAIKPVEVIYKKEDGSFAKFKTVQVTGKDAEKETVVFGGKEYFQQKVKSSDGKEQTIFISSDEDDEQEVSEYELKAEKEEPKKDAWYETNTWNSWIDAGFNVVDKWLDAITGTDMTAHNDANDKENDGKIGFWEAAKHFVRGAILNPAKAMLKSPLKTLAVALPLVAACWLFPPLGVGLMYAGLAFGLLNIGVGSYQMLTAKTDAEDRNAWENIGLGVMTTFMSARGIQKANKASVAAKDIKSKRDLVDTLSVAKKNDVARQDAIEQIKKIKELQAKMGLNPDVAKERILGVLKDYHTQTGAPTCYKPLKTVIATRNTIPPQVDSLKAVRKATTARAEANEQINSIRTSLKEGKISGTDAENQISEIVKNYHTQNPNVSRQAVRARQNAIAQIEKHKKYAEPKRVREYILEVVKNYHTENPYISQSKTIAKITNPLNSAYINDKGNLVIKVAQNVSTTANQTKSGLELANDQAFEKLIGKPTRSIVETGKTIKDAMKTYRPSVFKEKYDFAFGHNDFMYGNGAQKYIPSPVKRQALRFDWISGSEEGKTIDDVMRYCTEARKMLAQGNQYQAEGWLARANKIQKLLEGADGKKAKELIGTVDNLASAIRPLKKPPVLKMTFLGEGVRGGFFDTTAKDEGSFGSQYLTLVSD